MFHDKKALLIGAVIGVIVWHFIGPKLMPSVRSKLS